MKTTKHSLKNILITILTLLSIVLCCGCQTDTRLYPEKLEELDGLRAGVMTGSIEEDAVLQNFPNSPMYYYNAKSDMVEALISNKIDYFVNSIVSSRNILEQTDAIKVVDCDPVYINDYAFIFKKDDEKAQALMEQFNEFVRKCDKEGVLDELAKVWMEDPKITDHPPVFDIPTSGENGVLTLGTSSTMAPLSFMYEDQITGLDIQLASMFAFEYGYGLKFADSDFAGVIPAVSSGKVDFGGAMITVTEERAKSVDFSEPYAHNEQYPVVMNKESVSNSLVENFKKTFIVENRWKLIASGLLTSFIISFFALLIGTILGFGLFLICRKSGKTFNNIVEKFTWIFSGLPMVVVLMILYYVIFAKSSMSGTIVACIAFGINVMLGVNSRLKTAVKSIDNGQIEGSLSLGFTDTQTLFIFVLPQAMNQFLPNYLTLIIDLIKGTSIVGYIAVQDLTKASDIIRSRTYEAFFPLIATAIIYLIIIVVITMLLNKITIKMDPKTRSKEEVLRRYNK